MFSEIECQIIFEDGSDGDLGFYSSDVGEYAFFRLNKGRAAIFTDFYSCREELSLNLWEWYSNNCVRRELGNGLNVALRYTHRRTNYNTGVVESSDDKMQKSMNHIAAISTHALNLLEKKAEWPLTECCPGKINWSTAEEKRACAVGIALFKANSLWRISPQMFSLFTLLMRCGHHTSLSKCKTAKDLLEKIQALSSGQDSQFYKKTQDWLLIMSHIKELFKPKYRENWVAESYHRDYSRDDEDDDDDDDYGYDNSNDDDHPIHEGIDSFLRGECNNTPLYQKFKEIRNKSNKLARAKSGA